MGNMYFTHEVSAMTDCGMMVSKKDFQDAGGFDERLSEWFAGVDLCLKQKIRRKYDSGIDKFFDDEEDYIQFCDFFLSSAFIYEHSGIDGHFIDNDISYDEYYNSNLTTKCSNWMIGQVKMSNKLVKSKKKNTVSKYNGIDKNKKSIIVCLVVSFVISLLLSGIYFNSNYIKQLSKRYHPVYYCLSKNHKV